MREVVIGRVAPVQLLAEADEREVRDFCSERLADFKVPRKVLFLDEIPKGPTGKNRWFASQALKAATTKANRNRISEKGPRMMLPRGH